MFVSTASSTKMTPYFGCQIDHIISEKHGGATEADNLALACTFCNLNKGSDIASLASDGNLARFFNPRQDKWAEHFRLTGAVIEPLTAVTVCWKGRH